MYSTIVSFLLLAYSGIGHNPVNSRDLVTGSHSNFPLLPYIAVSPSSLQSTLSWKPSNTIIIKSVAALDIRLLYVGRFFFVVFNSKYGELLSGNSHIQSMQDFSYLDTCKISQVYFLLFHQNFPQPILTWENHQSTLIESTPLGVRISENYSELMSSVSVDICYLQTGITPLVSS